MVEAVAAAEKRSADTTAEEYASRGYEVARDCELEFFPGFSADIVARRGSEAKVVEVKTRSSLRIQPQVHELARILRNKPGWSFDLVLVGEPDILEPPKVMNMVDRETLDLRISEAEDALASGLHAAAFLVTWSVCEAALRAVVEPANEDLQRISPTQDALDRAAFDGAIDREDYDFLADAMKIRNALAHGFGVDEPEPGQVVALLEIAKKILGNR